MTFKQNDPVINRKLIAILDHLIQEGHWDKSLFLQATHKEIQALRGKFINELDLEIPVEHAYSEIEIAHRKLKEPIPERQQEVYVAVYHAEGTKISNWENRLELLLARGSSRPIYSEEASVKDLLVKKKNSPNNAYAAILINKEDIIPLPEKHVTDKFGHELLTLREEALRIENVRRFVHLSGSYLLDSKKHFIKQKNS